MIGITWRGTGFRKEHRGFFSVGKVRVRRAIVCRKRCCAPSPQPPNDEIGVPYSRLSGDIFQHAHRARVFGKQPAQHDRFCECGDELRARYSRVVDRTTRLDVTPGTSVFCGQSSATREAQRFCFRLESLK